MARSDGAAAEIAAIMARFDHVVESSKVGVRKPDPAIYRMMCAALGVAASDCVYLDDLGINCKPAAMLGMHAIKVTSGEQALTDLSARSEEHTSELQSLMRISYAVFCLKKKTLNQTPKSHSETTKHKSIHTYINYLNISKMNI